MRSPLNHPLILTQRFGANPKNYPYTNGHPGIDLRSPLGDDWLACVPGVVHFYNRFYPLLQDRSYRGYGRVVCLDWGQADGTFIRFLYGHGTNRRNDGRNVAEGTFLADSGNTGTSTAPHLHFEMRWFHRGGKYYDYQVRGWYDLLNPETEFLKKYKIPYT